MGLIFNGNGDVIKAVDGSLTVEGLDLDSSSTNINAGIVTGTSANFTGAVSVGGVLTYEDVKNVDSVGIVTAREGVFIPDNKKLQLGNAAGSADLEIFHDGSHSYVKDTGTGDLVLQGTNNVWLQHGNGENALKATQDAGVELRFNNLAKLQTSSSGATVTGDITISDKIIHAGDTNTTLRFPSADTITAETGGSERVRITSAGLFGIGVTPISIFHVRPLDETNFLVRNEGSTVVLASETNSGRDNNRGMALEATQFEFIEGGSEKIRIDSSGRVLIGTTTEGEVSADDLTIATSGNTGITIRSGTSNSGNLFFSDGTSGNDEIRGYVQYLHSSNALLFGTNAGERLRITSGGDVIVGGTSVGASGSFSMRASGHVRSILAPSNAGDTLFGAISGVSNGFQINVDSSNNQIYTFHNGSQVALRLDSSSNLMLGTSTAIQKFTIDGGGISLDNGWNVQWGVNASRAYIQGEDENGNDRLILGTSNTERLRIDGNGKVIVAQGQVHASRVLARFGIDCHGIDIYDGVGVVANYGMAFYNDPTTNKANGIGFFNDDGQTCGGYIVHQDKGGSNIGDLIFATAAVANTPVERLRLTSGGQLIQYTTHTTGNSAHSNTSWYGDDASQYTIEIRDFNEMYAVKTANSNSYQQIIYKREKMTHNCDIEFMLAGGSDQASSNWYHLGMTICGDGSDTMSNFDTLIFRCHGNTASSNHIRVDKGGGGTGFTSQGTHVPQLFDGNDRHIQIKIRGRRYSIYSDGVEIATKYSDTDNPRQNGFFGFAIYEASTVNPWLKIRDFKLQNYSLNTSLPSWEVIKSVPASTNNSYHYTVTDLNNPRTVEIRFWRLRHSGATGRMYMRLGPSSGYITSGYYDIGTYRAMDASGATIARGHNQGQWTPLHYDFNNPTNYYSGCITLRRISNSGRNTRIIYESSLVVDYDSSNTQYYNNCAGQMAFANSNPWDRITFYNESTSATLNYGELEILAQH